MTDGKKDDIQERLVALTRDLILYPSIPSRPEDITRCYESIKNHLEYLDNIEVREFEDNGHPSLVAAPPGCHKPDILLCGHLDVVAHPNLDVYRSEVREGRIYGPGAGDMKGAIAVLLEVFRSIHSKANKASLGIVITSDEESGGANGVGYLVSKEKLRCKLALIPDGGSINEITVAEKGILHLTVHAKGRSGHASRPWAGVNPIENLLEGLTKLKEHFKTLHEGDENWHPTCTVTIMGTENETFNRIPAWANAVLDIRFPAPFTVKKVYSEIKEILGPEIESEIIISAEPTDFELDPIYKQITEEVTGKEAYTNRDHGGSDSRYFSDKGIPVLISRPIVGNLHGEEEWIDIESMVHLYQIYEKFLTQKLLS